MKQPMRRATLAMAILGLMAATTDGAGGDDRELRLFGARRP